MGGASQLGDCLYPSCTAILHRSVPLSPHAGRLSIPLVVHPQRPGRVAGLSSARGLRQPGRQAHGRGRPAGGASWSRRRVLQLQWNARMLGLHKGEVPIDAAGDLQKQHMAGDVLLIGLAGAIGVVQLQQDAFNAWTTSRQAPCSALLAS